MHVRGDRHDAIRQTGLRVDLRPQLTVRPAVIVLAGRKTQRFESPRPPEKLVAPLARKKTGKHRVIRLPDQNKLVALLLNNHCAALIRSPTRRLFFGCAPTQPLAHRTLGIVSALMRRVLPVSKCRQLPPPSPRPAPTSPVYWMPCPPPPPAEPPHPPTTPTNTRHPH